MQNFPVIWEYYIVQQHQGLPPAFSVYEKWGQPTAISGSTAPSDGIGYFPPGRFPWLRIIKRRPKNLTNPIPEPNLIPKP